LILIKSDKVEFLGGPNMDPILVINENKVEAVKFSPCENYIVLYCPKKDMPYIIWNFITGKMIREFDQVENEDVNAF